MMQIKLGFEEWRKLGKEIERIAQNEELELIISMTFGFSGVEGNEGENEEEEGVEEGHEHHHHHITELPKEVIEELGYFMDTLRTKYNAKMDHHVHGDHAGVVASIMINGKDAISIFRNIIDDARNCENCILAGIDGELHLGNDVSVIFFGDSYKLTFILPAQDGRRLIISEVNT
ncbi:MAG: hypothetical protein ACP5L5_09080 [Vulcanisaeta sp.]|uniref:Uncharacterized protein n=1 Tax=Vulcanisaeta moutnovskia (strain 768-28) TaxID=985053 RepID=F0QTY9_VULM7|nr:hypothetical protein [Vulcanisaeta moutnovskia]ADY01775.1 hypothetical protein VMUT_1571 [Vulcanisaeta moutnovskia 768-28]